MSAKKMENVIYEERDRIAFITMNQPEKRNPLTLPMLGSLREAINSAASNDDIRVVVMAGAGKSFSAGADMKKEVIRFQKMSPHEIEVYLKLFYGFFTDVINLEKPVISAINGHAIATGFDLILVSDFAIAAEDARMGDLRVNMGLCPSIGAFYLARHLGIGRAKAITMLGELLDAATAQKLGLVYQVVPPAELLPAATILAGKLAGSAFSVGAIKKVINYAVQTDLDSCMKYFSGIESQVTQSADHREAVTAFFEKRPPVFKGK